MAFTFKDFIFYLERIGVREVILPFLLVFAIVYATLQKTKILGTYEVDGEKKPKSNLNIVVSLVMGFAVIFPHFSRVGPDVIPIFNEALPQVTLVLIALIAAFVLIGAWDIKFVENISKSKDWFMGLIAALAFLTVLYIFGGAADWWQIPYVGGLSPDIWMMIGAILVFGIIVYFITSEEES